MSLKSESVRVVAYVSLRKYPVRRPDSRKIRYTVSTSPAPSPFPFQLVNSTTTVSARFGSRFSSVSCTNTYTRSSWNPYVSKEFENPTVSWNEIAAAVALSTIKAVSPALSLVPV